LVKSKFANMFSEFINKLGKLYLFDPEIKKGEIKYFIFFSDSLKVSKIFLFLFMIIIVNQNMIFDFDLGKNIIDFCRAHFDFLLFFKLILVYDFLFSPKTGLKFIDSNEINGFAYLLTLSLIIFLFFFF
jgi:hypothetical protein